MSILLGIFLISTLGLRFVGWKQQKYVLFAVSLALGYISFFFVASEQSDLYRHYQTMELYNDMGFEFALFHEGYLNPLTTIMLYAFSQLNEPAYLPAFIVFIVYSLSFYILYASSRRFNLSKNNFCLLYLFLLGNLNYMLIVSNMRIFLLFALFAFFFYREFIEDKSHISATVFYGLSILFHYGIAPLVVFRVLALIFDKNTKRKWFLIVFLLLVSFLAIRLIPNGNVLSMIESIGDKNTSYSKYTVFGTWQYLNSMLCIIVSLIAWLLVKKANMISLQNYIKLMLYIFVFLLLFITNYQVILRYSNLVASMAIVLFSILFYLRRKLFEQIVFAQSVFALVYSFVYVYNHIEFLFNVSN